MVAKFSLEINNYNLFITTVSFLYIQCKLVSRTNALFVDSAQTFPNEPSPHIFIFSQQ